MDLLYPPQTDIHNRIPHASNHTATAAGKITPRTSTSRPPLFNTGRDPE